MSKTYKDGLLEVLGIIEDVYAEKSPIDDFNEAIQEVVDEVYERVNRLADVEKVDLEGA